MHSAQGVTADTTHAVLGDTTSRNLLYVAMTRGRDSNQAYLHERIAGEGDHEHAQPNGLHTLRRGTSRGAAQLMRGIIANQDDRAHTAHHIAAETAHPDLLPDRVSSLLDRRVHAVQARCAAYRDWHERVREHVAERQRWAEQHISHSHDRSLDYGIDL